MRIGDGEVRRVAGDVEQVADGGGKMVIPRAVVDHDRPAPLVNEDGQVVRRVQMARLARADLYEMDRVVLRFGERVTRQRLIGRAGVVLEDVGDPRRRDRGRARRDQNRVGSVRCRSAADRERQSGDPHKSSGWVPCPSPAQPGAGMSTVRMAALRLAMAPGASAPSHVK